MQRNEVIEFLNKIDRYIAKNYHSILGTEKFELKVIGKCSLFLAGMTDTIGTVDLDSLQIKGQLDPKINETVKASLITEFGRTNLAVHGYYLEFVAPAIVFLPSHPKWEPLQESWNMLSVEYLNSNDMIASKCFSAFSSPSRKKDLQDIISALDQKIVTLKNILMLADQIFVSYGEDARSERFPLVYRYITEELIPHYGGGKLNYFPEVE